MSWKGPRPCWKCGQPVQWYCMSFYGRITVRGIRVDGRRLAPVAHLTSKGKHWVVCKGSKVPANCKPTPVKTTLSRKDLALRRWRENKLNDQAKS